MTRKALILLMIAALAALFVVGCSNDDDDSNPTGGGGNTATYEAPAVVENLTSLQESGVASHLASIDNTQDPHSYGSMAATYISLASSAGVFLTPSPSAARQDRPSLALADTVTYTWTDAAGSTTMLWIETSTEYVWKAMRTGTGYGTDFVVIEAHQSLTTSNGWMEMYDPEVTGYFLRWEWSETAGAYTVTLTVSDGVDEIVIDIVVNADGSGYVEFTEGDDYWQITWNAAGTSGTWTDNYDSGVWSYTG